MSKLIIPTLLLTILCCYSRAQAVDSSEERHQKYVELNRQIYMRHGDSESGVRNSAEENTGSTLQQLHNLISQVIKTVLAAPKPTDASITTAISQLQGGLSMAGWESGMNIPFAKFFTLNNIPTLAVGYVILQGGDAIPNTQVYLEFYDNSSGVWEKKASAPTRADFKHTTFYVAQLNSGVAGEAWFLTWGTMIGSSHGSKTAYLYAFDGSTVRTVWQRKRLPGGTINVAPNTVTLEYEDENAVGARAREILHVTPNGLE